MNLNQSIQMPVFSPEILNNILENDFSIQALENHLIDIEKNYKLNPFENSQIFIKVKDDYWLESSLIDDDIERVHGAVTNINQAVNINIGASINIIAVMNIATYVNTSIG